MTTPLRVAVVSRHELTRVGLAQLLGREGGRLIVEFPSAAAETTADVIICDLAGLDPPGGRILQHLIAIGRPVIALQPCSLRHRAESILAMGATHVVSTDVTGRELREVVEHAAAGRRLASTSARTTVREAAQQRVGLTEREIAVLELVAAGLSNDEIAAALFITINTVKSYVRTAYKRIGAVSRSQAVIWALDHGLGPGANVDALSPG